MNEGGIGEGNKTVPKLHEMFVEVQVSNFKLILDPILRVMCLDSCLGLSKQRRILERVEEKFNAELDVTVMLDKLRSSYAVIRKLMNSRT